LGITKIKMEILGGSVQIKTAELFLGTDTQDFLHNLTYLYHLL